MTASEIVRALRMQKMQEQLRDAIDNFDEAHLVKCRSSREYWYEYSWYHLFLWAALKKGIEL